MATITVTTTPQAISATWSDMQNLSESVAVYFDTDSDVSSSTGMKLAAGEAYARPNQDGFKTVYVVTASSTADLRTIG